MRRHGGLADDVREAILGQLAALKIAPGARTAIDNLVRQARVSHTPIREALGHREGEGLPMAFDA